MELFDFQRLFAYDSWANREVLASLSAAGSPPQRAVKLLAHILGAEEVWYSRILGRSPVLAVWPELDEQRCQQEQERLHGLWSNYLATIEPGQLGSAVNYKNSKGEAWTSQIQDILLHVVMHSAYHRGQIASDLRAAGFSPPYTDFIHGIRRGLVV